MGQIVVGIDGSGHAIGALRWATEEAVLRGTELVVLCAWEFPPALNPGDDADHGGGPFLS